MNNFKFKVFTEKDKGVTIFFDLCKGCGLCLEKCPQKAISFSKKYRSIYSTPSIEIDIKKCNRCGICEIVCPDSALKVKNKHSLI